MLCVFHPGILSSDIRLIFRKIMFLMHGKRNNIIISVNFKDLKQKHESPKYIIMLF